MRTKLFFLFFFNGKIKLKQAKEYRPPAPSVWKVKARRSEKKNPGSETPVCNNWNCHSVPRTG